MCCVTKLYSKSGVINIMCWLEKAIFSSKSGFRFEYFISENTLEYKVFI